MNKSKKIIVLPSVSERGRRRLRLLLYLRFLRKLGGRRKLAFFALLIFFVLLSGSFVLAAERALEITYPTIPGVATPKTVAVGLPEYVNYIFRFAVIIIGLIIFGILIYNGLIYLTSAGDPAKLSDAKSGIFAGLLGVVILLSSYLIFNTINPQLVNLELPPATLIKAAVVPGVYLCSYKVPDIGQILQKYTINNCNPQSKEERDARNEAAKKLKEAMGTPDNPKRVCFLVNSSGPLVNFVIESGGDKNTIFIIPEDKYVAEEKKFVCQYNYGFVLHETNRFTGKCRLYPRPGGAGGIYRQLDSENFQADMEFTAKAITIFKKPWQEPIAEALGVTLYEGLGFNEIGWEEGKTATSTGRFPISLVLAAEDPNYLKRSFKPGDADVLIVNEQTLKESFKTGSDRALYHNTRSIRIEPKDGYIAILLGDEKDGTKGEANEKCEVRRTDDANLTDDDIGRCGTCKILQWSNLNPLNWGKGCYPCLEYMIVVKGQAL